MKKITFLFVLLTVSLGYSQQVVLEDFEGTAPSTDLFDGFTSALVEADPVNAAEQSLELITSAAGNPWQGAKLTIQNTTIDMTTADKTMTVDVYSNTPVDFLFKLVDGEVGGLDNNQESKTASSHTGSGWETLTLDFNIGADTGQPGYNPPNDRFGGIVFFPLYIAPNDGWNPAAITTTYVDNITGISGGIVETCNDGILNNGETAIDCGGPNCDACPSPPTVAAPTPPNRALADVISLYSGAYTAVGSNFDAGWCGGSSVAEEMIAGNATMAYKGNNCQGIILDVGVDASTFTNLHVDIYIQAGTDLTSSVFNLKFVQQPGGAALEINLNAASSPALVAGSWLSVDIPVDLTTFTGFKEFGITSNLNNIVWYDNLYVHNNTVLDIEEFETASFRAFPNPTNGDWNISGSTVINKIAVYDILGKQVIVLTPNANETTIDASSLNSGIYFARIEGIKGSKTVKLIKE
jgi:hypothetical protein